MTIETLITEIVETINSEVKWSYVLHGLSPEGKKKLAAQLTEFYNLCKDKGDVCKF